MKFPRVKGKTVNDTDNELTRRLRGELGRMTETPLPQDGNRDRLQSLLDEILELRRKNEELLCSLAQAATVLGTIGLQALSHKDRLDGEHFKMVEGVEGPPAVGVFNSINEASIAEPLDNGHADISMDGCSWDADLAIPIQYIAQYITVSYRDRTYLLADRDRVTEDQLQWLPTIRRELNSVELDGIPEAYRALYEWKEDSLKWVLKTDFIEWGTVV